MSWTRRASSRPEESRCPTSCEFQNHPWSRALCGVILPVSFGKKYVSSACFFSAFLLRGLPYGTFALGSSACVCVACNDSG